MGIGIGIGNIVMDKFGTYFGQQYFTVKAYNTYTSILTGK